MCKLNAGAPNKLFYLGGIAQYTKGSQIESLLSNIPELKIILINSRIERNTLR